MVNRQKIITMTKLALYDKHEGAADRAANDYFRHDYIYRKNLGTRISVGVAGIVILVIRWLSELFVEGVDIFEINIQEYIIESVLFIVALVAAYSLIGTIQGTREYYLVQKRLNRYQGMLRFLESAEERAARPSHAPQPVYDEEEPLTDRQRTRQRSVHAQQTQYPQYPQEEGVVDELRSSPRHRDADENYRRRELREVPGSRSRIGVRGGIQTLSGSGGDGSPTQYAPTPPKKADPLANVSSRALSGSGSRTRSTRPLTRRPSNQDEA